MKEEDRKWFKAYCTEIVTQIVSHGKCSEHLINELLELLEKYCVSEKQIGGLILRARIELKKPLEDEDVRAFCEKQLAILSIVPDK